MTSRVSLTNQIKELLKRHLTSTLILLLALIIHFIGTYMVLDNILDYADFPFKEYQIENIVSVYSPHITNGLFALTAGAYMAFDYFKYLHSKKQTDFYESLPITRKERFLMNLGTTFVIYAVLLFVTLMAELIIVNGSGIDMMLIFSKTLWNYICMLGIYLASWVTAVLAITMTGHPVVAIMGYGAFSVYVPILLYNIIPTFASIYYDTYVKLPSFEKFNFWEIMFMMSPASIMYRITSSRNDYWEFVDHKNYLIGMIIFVIVVGYIAYRLFSKRASESAGRAMAFEKANGVIRILIVIPIALYLGIFLQSISAQDSEAWLLFGILFAGFICHGLIQGIFEADIRAIFTKKKQLLLSYFICFAILAVFRFDIFKFDEYVPDADKVERVYVETNDFADYSSYGFSDGVSGDTAKIALQAAEEIISADDWTNENEYNLTSIEFHYELKNGMTISRQYVYGVDHVPKSLDALATTVDFKDDYCLFFKKAANEFNSFKYTYDYDNYSELNQTYWNDIVNAYKEEFVDLTFTDMYKEFVTYRFFAAYDDDDEESNGKEIVTYSNPYINEYELSATFDVHESFIRTIDLLNKAGYKSFAENEDLSIVSMEVYAYEEEYEYKKITDKEVLAKLKPYASLSDLNRNRYDDDVIVCWAFVDTGDGEMYTELCFRKTDFEKIVK